MDKIKTVKIKNPDGSISEESYTISVDAKDVDMKNGKDLQDTIGTINVDTNGNISEQLDNLNENVNNLNIDIKKKAYFFDTVADMKNANVKVGDYVCTLGYYTVNDGGAAEYQIINNNTNSDYYEELNNGLLAKIILKDHVTPEMFGAYADNIHDDTQAIQKSLNHNIRHAVLSRKYKTSAPLSIPSWKIVDGGGEIHSSNIGFILDGVRFVHLSDLKIYSVTVGIKISTENNYCAYNTLNNLFCSGNESSGSKGLHLETTNYYMNEQSYDNCVF